ncbi:MAG: hypothetical protein ACPL3P_05125 [Anaerolineales bacterium]
MKWDEVRKVYPDQWLIIEAIKAHSEAGHRLLDKIAVLETCEDGMSALKRYRELRQTYPDHEYYYVHTSREELDIYERQWLGIRRGHESISTR